MSKRRRRDLKEQVSGFLHAADDQGLLGLVRTEPRTMRFLLGRLWDDDTPVRRQAIAALFISANTSVESADSNSSVRAAASSRRCRV